MSETSSALIVLAETLKRLRQRIERVEAALPADNSRDGTDGQDGRDGRDGQDGIDGRDGIDGIDGKDGKDGKDGRDGTAPEHEWDGSKLRFKTPEGEWGQFVNLKGPKGDRGQPGHDGLNGWSSGGGAKFDPDDLPLGAAGIAPELVIVKQAGAWVKLSWQNLLDLLPNADHPVPYAVTRHGRTVTVGGEPVLITPTGQAVTSAGQAVTVNNQPIFIS